MSENAKLLALYYTIYARDLVAGAAQDTKEFVAENKSEMTRTAAIASVVYIGSRIAGFKAGYKYAKSPVVAV